MSTAQVDEVRAASPERVVPGTPLAGTTLNRALSFEYMRLKGLRSTWVAIATMAALSLLNGVLLPTEAVEPKVSGQPSLEVTQLVDSLQFNPIGMQIPLSAWLLVFVLGSGPFATEFRHRTAQTAWLTIGTRGLSYAAKLLVGAGGSLAICVVGLALSAIGGATALAVTGLAQPHWSGACGPLLRYLIVMTFLPVLAGSLTALIRSRLLSVLTLVLWPLLLERVFGLVIQRIPGMAGVQDWLPFAAARAAMSGVANPDELTRLLIGSDLAPLPGLGVFCSFSALVATCGWLAYRRQEAS
ncbi:ABC transporter permease [Streptomyces graminilatus]|uniref:ABC transporter permease n=1 Tax=Streptomyces graminilatus TaxID=1464070 RepID=UPI0006E2F2DB|nr:ABC transporter permease [Streptomyces graminilatus]